MKQLSIILQGDFKDEQYLLNEIEDIGHTVVINQEITPNYDTVIFSTPKIFNQNKPDNFNGYQVIISDHRILLYKNVAEAYVLFAGSAGAQLEADDLVTSITQLSRAEFSALETISFTPDAGLSATEYQLQINTWNSTAAAYAKDKTLHQLFEEQVMRTPDDIALVYHDMQLSYRELNERANQLAAYLISKYQIKSDDLVALCLNRSEHMLIAILGVLKAGGAYVPMDPTYPEERISFILEDTQSRVLLTNVEVVPSLVTPVSTRVSLVGMQPPAILTIDSPELQAILAKQPAENPNALMNSHNLAYVIYTSGTTGKPKGVMLEHHSVINLVATLNNVYDLQYGNKITAFTSYTFDVSVSEFFTALLRGAELHVFAEEVRRNPDLISEYLLSRKINYVYLPPVVLSVLPRIEYPELYGIVYAGEPCAKNTGKYWSAHKKLFNYYGPTETCIYSLGKVVIDGDVNLIGKPLNNTTAYILDENLKVLPVGAIGELYIGGAGLARGYLNRSDLTAERFIPNPFQSDADKTEGINSRLYKTGDLVKYYADGNIEYMGRNDFQVKIRGFRIELGEIESKLTGYIGISQAVILPHEVKSDECVTTKYLAAFYVADHEIGQKELQIYLNSVLPDYMVPSTFVQIDKLPLTINGKLDRANLLSRLENTITSFDYSSYGAVGGFLARLWHRLIVTNNKKIELSDSFFGLGGHSLLVTKLILKIREEYKIVLTPHQVYTAETLQGLINLVKTQAFGDVVMVNKPLPRLYTQAENKYLLTPYQSGIYFAHLSDNKAYTVPLFIKTRQQLDSIKAEHALINLVTKFKVLCGYLTESTDGIYQNYIPANPVIETVAEQELDKYLKILADKVFNLQEALSDFRIIQINDSLTPFTVISFTHHHLVADGYSIELIIKEYFALYAAVDKSMPLDSYSYADVVNYIMDEEILQSPASPVAIGPIEYPLNPHFSLHADNSKISSGTSAEFSLSFSAIQKSQLRDLARKYNTTINAIMLSGLYIALYRYSGEERVNLGIVFSNRDNPITQDTVGCMVNTLPLEIAFTPQMVVASASEFIPGFVDKLNNYMKYSSYPLRNVIEYARAVSGDNALFNVVFASQYIDESFESENGLSKFMPSNKRAKFDLSFNFYHTLDPQRLEIEFNIDKYSADYIQNFAKTLQIVLQDMDTAPAISGINILDDADYQKLIYSWNETDKPYPADKTIIELFESQVVSSPESIAIVFEDTKLTYQQLNDRANQLATFLRDNYQIKGDDLVALCLNRSENILIAILGVLKAGAAFVPMDPSYPEDRINFILDDTKARVLLTNAEVAPLLDILAEEGKTSPAILAIDSKDFKQQLSSQSTQNLVLNISSQNLAYVIYTSGTTGKPKGVMIEHRSVMNLCTEFIHTHLLDRYNQVAIYSNYVFDAFVYETIPSLVNGNQLFLLNEEIRLSLVTLGDYLRTNQVKIMFVPTILLKEFLVTLYPHNPLRLIYTGGEKLPVLDPQFIGSNLTILNEYGPTESTVCSTFKRYEPGVLNTNIGKPVANIATYILDAYLQPVPVGVIGELYIGGESLGRGYLNRPELTTERFITNPFKISALGGKNSRIYKTGDLVRYLPDGDIDYIGRNDFQVKIRGFRIELGEIEAVLNRYTAGDITQSIAIKQSAVLALEQKDANGVINGNKFLVAYYVADKEFPEAELLRYLGDNLPEYMVPSILIHLTKLPQTVNGKLDTKALPQAIFKSDNIYIAPQNQLEVDICTIYAKTLGLDITKVGMHDDFFRLGGNSILAIRLVNQLNAQTQIKVSVANFFRYKTIRELIADNGIADAEVVKIPQIIYSATEITRGANLRGQLSYAQERLWFFEKYSGGSYAYNIPVLYPLNPTLNLHKLETALNKVVKRHQVLYSFIETDFNGQGYCVIQDLELRPLRIMKHRVKDKAGLYQLFNQEAYHIYNLANEYPLRISIFSLETNPTVYYLGLVVHHIAFDGWSMDVFLRDLNAFYTDSHLPELDITYKDFAAWQKNYLTASRLELQSAYWYNKLADYAGLNLPSDFSRPPVARYDGDNLHFSIDRVTSNKLRELSRQLGLSLYGVLLSGFYLFLRAYSNQDDIVIGSPIANRNYAELENLIGFFVNTVGLRSKIDSNQKLKDYISQVGKDALEAQLYQDIPFEKVVNQLNLIKDQSRHPLFQVLFGVQDFGSIAKINTPLFNNDSEVNGIFSDYKVAKFDLTVMIDDFSECLTGVFNFATSLYTKETIQCFIDTYVLILQQLPEKLEQQVVQLNYLSTASYQQLMYELNSNSADYPKDNTLQCLFEEQVCRTPDNIALVFGNLSLSYAELNQRANRLANYLLETYKIVTDDLIVLCLNRSENMLIAILAVLKAGAAYVAVDPAIPEERLAYIVEDTQTRVIIANEHNSVISGLTRNLCPIIMIDNNDFQQSISIFSTENPQTNATANNLAYVIYTSGTTGKPKGVLHKHQAMVNGVFNELRSGVIDSSSHVLAKTAYVYDPSVREMFMPLLLGARLYLVDEAMIRDNVALLGYIKENAINLMLFAPSHLAVFISDMEDNNDYSSLEGINLFCCGERLSIGLCDKLVNQFKVNVYAQYGVSELSQVLCTTRYDANGSEFYISANNKAYIVDANFNPLPAGAIGELYIGGAGLAQGYLNLPQLTNERFIVNPFQSEAEKAIGNNERIYKTGDLALYTIDGRIEYFGRNDFQVKIRGFRIEPEEIESRLLDYPGIKQAVVIAKESQSEHGAGSKYLLAYYVAEHKLDEPAMREQLSRYLPEYMLPDIFVYLTELPLTINGKLDRRALPEVQFNLSNNYIAPTTAVERKVCSLFAVILGLEAGQIGIKDDFFRIGGNSILSIKLVSKLNNTFLSRLKVAEIFSAKCVENIAKLLQGSVIVNYQTLVKLNAAENKPALFLLHPATGGCEVYSPIADKLAGYYQCYGIDNYNLHHEIKYPTLNTLAQYYLSVMRNEGRLQFVAEKITLFGWCLGGLIALEIAAILEADGYTNIDLYLLDTVIHDDALSKTTDTIDKDFIKKMMRETLINKYEKSYVEKIVNNFDTENGIGKEKVSRKLVCSRIYLYKAMQKDTRIQMDIIDTVFNQVKAIKYNNIDSVVNDVDKQIKLINLEDAHHGNILEQQIIIDKLINVTVMPV